MIDLTEDEIKKFVEFDKFIDEFCKRHHFTSCEECPLGEMYCDQNIIEHWGCSVEDFPHRLGIRKND